MFSLGRLGVWVSCLLVAGVMAGRAQTLQGAVQSGTAVAGQLGAVYEDGAGPFVSARAGDWRLANEYASLTFVGVDDAACSVSSPVGGYVEVLRPQDRVPGALIDIAVDGYVLDMLACFSQGIGRNNKGDLIQYDSVQTVSTTDSVGLCFSGSPFSNAPVRLSTTYWLAAGSHRVVIESRLSQWDQEEDWPEICDEGHWGAGMLYTPDYGALAQTMKPFNTTHYGVAGDHYSLVITPHNSKMQTQGTLWAESMTSRAAYAWPDDQQTDQISAQPLVREMWLSRGLLIRPMEYMQADRKVPCGTLSTEVTTAKTGQPVPGAKVRIQMAPNFHADMTEEEAHPIEYATLKADEKGHVEAALPAGYYFFRVETEYRAKHMGSSFAHKLDAGQTITPPLRAHERSGVQVKVLDKATSQPLAARLCFEPISPTRPYSFGAPLQARGYLSYAYIPAQGDLIYLPGGNWVITASHGPQYEISDQTVVLQDETIQDVTIVLEKSCPIAPWVSMEIGLRTRKTPGCEIDPGDAVLMAAAEGLHWLVSGDFETLTDYAPFIKQAGLEGSLKSMIGFRTMLPSHPQWGQFLVFPVAPDAPDPAQARQQWAGLTQASDFIAVLRKLYPGALIQADLPLSPDLTIGYFASEGKSPHVVSYMPPSEIDLSIDAINMYPSRVRLDFKSMNDFINNNFICGRFYLTSTSSSGRSVYGGEPGYPRLMVYTGRQDPSEVDEACLLEGLGKRCTQVTTGPFIEFSVENKLPGELCPFDLNAQVSIRAFAPTWMNINSISFDKEGLGAMKNIFGQNTGIAQRYPNPAVYGNNPRLLSLKDLQFMDIKDTLLSVYVQGGEAYGRFFPRYPSYAVSAFAVTSPVIVDANDNQKYDPLTSYRDKGK